MAKDHMNLDFVINKEDTVKSYQMCELWESRLQNCTAFASLTMLTALKWFNLKEYKMSKQLLAGNLSDLVDNEQYIHPGSQSIPSSYLNSERKIFRKLL